MNNIMKGISCCADCAYYSMKKHRCTRASDEGKPADHFYADCPLPTVTKEQGWISVKDRMPDEKHSEITHDFEYCLCATTFGDVRPYKFGTPIGWNEPHFWHGSGIMDEYVTHWMPLPEPPKEET